MTKNPPALTLTLSDQQIILGARALAQAMFDMAVRGSAPAPTEIPIAAASLPAIGTEVNGEIYAGLSIEYNRPVALWLLPGDEKMNWNDAVAWAKKKGGVLPSRFDQLVLFTNLKKEFQETWYWSGEQSAPDPDYAWCQGFYGGSQGYGHEGGNTRVRAVRRSVIQ